MDINLILLKKKGVPKSFSLPSSVTVIGRRHNCDLCIPVMSVSKRHCQLNHDNGVLKIRDLGSRNGTHINGKRIDEAVIKSGDSLKIGPLEFVLQINGQPEQVVSSTSATADLPGKDRLTEDANDEQFDSFADLDDIEPLDEPETI